MDVLLILRASNQCRASNRQTRVSNNHNALQINVIVIFIIEYQSGRYSSFNLERKSEYRISFWIFACTGEGFVPKLDPWLQHFLLEGGTLGRSCIV